MRHTTGHVLSAVHIAVHAPSSRTSLRAPSTFCAHTPSAPSASPRMSLYRARRRARPPHMSSAFPTLPPTSPVACAARSMSPTSCTRACTTPASPTLPGTSLCTSPASSCTTLASSSSPRLSHVPRVCCIAAHVPHGTRRRVRLRPGYTVGVPVLI
ncbi:hypothetical protein B0H14DRAFT_3073724, partial [Mycena olivaceomarginata]